MSGALSTIPDQVDIEHYAGDTLYIAVTVDTAYVAGRTVTAQVRKSKTSNKVDATFVVIPTATGFTLQLVAEDTQELAKRGEYVGWWDVQLAEADGSDPVTTLCFGELKLHNDVTRRIV